MNRNLWEQKLPSPTSVLELSDRKLTFPMLPAVNEPNNKMEIFMELKKKNKRTEQIWKRTRELLKTKHRMTKNLTKPTDTVGSRMDDRQRELVHKKENKKQTADQTPAHASGGRVRRVGNTWIVRRAHICLAGVLEAEEKSKNSKYLMRSWMRIFPNQWKTLIHRLKRSKQSQIQKTNRNI